MRSSKYLQTFSAKRSARPNSMTVDAAKNLIAAGFDDGAIRVLDLSTATLTHTIQAHDDEIRCVLFSPDGYLIASASNDRTIKLLHIDGGERATLGGHPDRVRCLAWSPGGKHLAAGVGDGTLCVWDTAGHARLWTGQFNRSPVRCVLWSDDGSTIVTGCMDGTIMLWDAGSGKLASHFSAHRDAVLSLCWVEDGMAFASSSSDLSVSVWTLRNLECIAQLLGHSDSVLSISWERRNSILASASSDGDLRTWDISTGECLSAFGPQGVSARAVIWAGSDRLLVGAYSDCRIRIWNTESKQVHSTLPFADTAPSAVSDSDGKVGVGTNDGGLFVIADHPTPRVFSTQTGLGRISSIAFRNDTRQVIAGFSSGACRTWEWDGDAPSRAVGDHLREVRAIAVAPATGKMFTASTDKRVLVHHLDHPDDLHQFTRTAEPFLALALHEDKPLLAGAMTDPSIHMWDTTCGSAAAALEGHRGSVVALAWSPSGRLLATAATDNTIRIWHPFSGAKSHLLGESCNVHCLLWCDTDRFLIAVGADGGARMYDLKTNCALRVAEGCAPGLTPLHASINQAPLVPIPAELGLHHRKVELPHRWCSD